VPGIGRRAARTAKAKIARPQAMSSTMCACRHHGIEVAPATE
jgi:hypothetical protein